MDQAIPSVSRDPFGTTLPPDVLSAAVDQLNDIVMVCECEPMDEPGPRILFVNPAFQKFTGWTAAEVLGRSPRFLVGPETDRTEIARIEQLQNRKQPWRSELLNYRKDGTHFWFEIEANTTRSPSTGQEYFVFVQRDITGRKKAEEQQREQARTLSTLFANLPGMAFRSVNRGSWKMEFVSDGCRELTGYPPEDLIGTGATPFEAIIEQEDRKGVVEAIDTAVARGEPFEFTFRIRSKDGALKWVWERGRAVPSNLGITVLEGFITDITERKLLEQQVLQNQRLESVGTLAGGIAHDLNNVFAPIMMAGDLLSDRIEEKDSNQLLDVIAASAKRGAELVRQILLFARGMEGPRVAVDPHALFNELKSFLDSTLPKSIRVSFEIPDDLSAINGDPIQLHQMLLNLSVNARDAMPAGGRLSVSASAASVSASAPRPHPDAVPGSFVRIDISDTGTGIPDILKGQIFDPFFTTKGVGRGSGLGLSTVRSIVKAHCGFITFTTSEGVGTTFSVFLPTSDAGPARPTRSEGGKPAAGPLPRGQGENILVVDDEESVRLIMRSTLESFGYRAVVAVDGAEAVTLFLSAPALFDLAVVDMQMPGLDGGKTIIAIRHIRPDLPIVGASGLATNQNREEAAASGVLHFLDKPFSVETLIRTVHSALEKKAP